MGTLEHDEWMSDSDAVLWHIERDPLLRSTITSVWYLDALPDAERMRSNVERMARALPRLHQHVVDAQPGVAPPRWTDDALFDVDYHLRHVRLTGRPNDRSVLDHAQRLAARSFDKDRPLWELEVVEGLPRGRGAFVMKVHHAIADGLGLIKLLGHIVSLGPDDDVAFATAGEPDDAQPASTDDTNPIAAAGRAVQHRLGSEARTLTRLGGAAARTASGFVRDPLGTVGRAGRTTGSIAKLVQPAGTPRSPLMTGRSLTLHLDTLDVPLEPVRAAARRVDATVNDAFVAVVLDALHRYHAVHERPTADIRLHMPVSLRAADGAGADTVTNQFVPARFVVPLDDVPLAERVAATKQRLREVRAEPALPHVNDIAGVVERFGPTATVTLIGSMMKGVDVTASNVPGPPFPVYLAGAKAERLFAYGPLAGSAINVTLLSYDGRLHLGITTDHAAVPDPDVFTTCLRTTLDDLVGRSQVG